MFLLLDNYDSFTYNLRHYLGELGAEVEVRRNDAISVDEAVALGAEGIVISPGPCDPDRAGICLDVIEKAALLKDRRLPILGVCRGFQCSVQVFGGKGVLAPKPMHGKVSEITHSGVRVLAGVPSPCKATRYHSLTIERESLPDCLEITAESDDGVIQGLRHRDFPIHGVQFHPESIASEHGHQVIQNFLDITRAKEAA